MEGDAPTVDAYVAGLPDERREAISAVREAVNANLAEDFEEMEAIGDAIAQTSVERHIAAYERSRG